MEKSSNKGIEPLLKLVDLVIPRLEKITPDSHWAHKASGCRRSILRAAASASSKEMDLEEINRLIDALQSGFRILEAAAIERTAKSHQSD